MDEYGEELLQHAIDYWARKKHRTYARSERRVSVVTPMNGHHVYEWMKKEEKPLLDQFPHVKAAIIQHTLDQEKRWYNLWFKEGVAEYTLTIEVPHLTPSNGEKRVTCYFTNGTSLNACLSIDDIREAFKKWVQHLPENRLRFVTGEWEMEGI